MVPGTSAADGSWAINFDGVDGATGVSVQTWTDPGLYFGYQTQDIDSFFQGDLARAFGIARALNAADRAILSALVRSEYGL